MKYISKVKEEQEKLNGAKKCLKCSSMYYGDICTLCSVEKEKKIRMKVYNELIEDPCVEKSYLKKIHGCTESIFSKVRAEILAYKEAVIIDKIYKNLDKEIIDIKEELEDFLIYYYRQHDIKVFKNTAIKRIKKNFDLKNDTDIKLRG